VDYRTVELGGVVTQRNVVSAILSVPVRAHGYVLFDEGLDYVEKDSMVDVHLLN